MEELGKWLRFINRTLSGGSLLMLNHEHWYDASPADDIDVVAVRWAAAF